MPVRHRELGDELAPPEPKRCRHCDESRSSCGGGGSEGPEGRAWRVTLDHDLVETLSAIYPEWFKQPRRENRENRAASPSLSPTSPVTPQTSPDNDLFSSGAEEMASGPANSSGGSEPPSSPPRLSPPKVVVDDSPLQPAMGKHKESLKVKLMMRRPINELVEQGIMPPLKTPAAYFKQVTQLERAKTGDLLKAKIQRRPDRHELERRHILEQEYHVDPSLAEKQRMLKKARLADQLNDQLSHRPGPLELIKKNILHTEENIETAVKSGILAFKATSEGASGRPQHPSSYCGPPDEVSPSPSPPATLSPASVSSTQHAAPGKDRNRTRCKKNKSCKSRFKFHEYKGPPSAQKASSPPESTETPYDLLLQQQQLLLQLMLPASPAASVASVTSDSSDALSAPPPPPLPPTPLSMASPGGLPGRFEDMKVSDLRAECKRRNLRVSGPKPQLIDRLRLNMDIKEEPPRSPMSVASPESKADSEQSEDIVQSQSRLIGELKRQLEESRQQLEAARRDNPGVTGGVQCRHLLQKYLCVTQLQAKLDALHQTAPAPPPPPRYVIATPDAARDHYVRLFTVTSPPNATEMSPEVASPKVPNAAYILNGVKVVPITILPSAHYEPERPAPPPPPPPPPLPPPPVPHAPVTPLENMAEGSLNEEIEDVLEILAKSGELPPSGVGDMTPNNSPDTGYHQDGSSDFTPSDILGDDLLGYPHVGDSLSVENSQRELNDIQNDILNRAEFNALNNRCDGGTIGEIDADLNVDLLASNEFHANFGNHPSPDNNDDLFDTLLGTNCDAATHSVMEIDEDLTERMSMTPMTNGDLHDHTRMGFDDMNDLSLTFHSEDSRHNGYEENPTHFGFRQFDLETSMTMDSDHYMESIPNLFSRDNTPRSDPVLGVVLDRPAPRPVHKHYSWDKIEYT